jgi:hypothetical protein
MSAYPRPDRLLLADSRSLTVATPPAALYITEGQQRTVKTTQARRKARTAGSANFLFFRTLTR